MLVDAQGNELDVDANGGPILTRGLIAQGFYEVGSPSMSCLAS